MSEVSAFFTALLVGASKSSFACFSLGLTLAFMKPWQPADRRVKNPDISCLEVISQLHNAGIFGESTMLCTRCDMC